MRELKLSQLEKPAIAAKPNGNHLHAVDSNGIPARFAGKRPISEPACTKKPKNKSSQYADWETLEVALRKLCNEHGGRLPSRKWLFANHHDDLVYGMAQHGGIVACWEKLGITHPNVLREKNAMRHFENILPVVKQILNENNGEFPSSRQLSKRTLLFVCAPTAENFEIAKQAFFKSREVKVEFGLAEEGMLRLSSTGDGMKQGSIVVVRNNGTLEAYRAPYYGFITLVHRHYGGYEKFRAMINKPLKEERLTGERSLSDVKNYLDVLFEIKEKNGGKIPIREELKKQGYGNFVSATYNGKKNLTGACVAAGCAPVRRVGKFNYKHWKVIAPVLEKIMKDNRFTILPKSTWHGWKCEHNAVYAAIKRHHQGILAVTERVGPRPLPYTESPQYEKWSVLRKRLIGIAKDNGGTLPTLDVFMADSKLWEELAAIYTYHKSLYHVRCMLEAEWKIEPVYQKKKQMARAVPGYARIEKW